ncbi:hypothetical protein [Chryseosolibacter indicus]|uniref:Glutamyl-tRNA reductase N-terminal domain-containing protein n=1 Tax=Chryseosolibacter indicus TaxID=2782351 RepID=A0ABS5VNV6_9BACT|nr:hypothetical protein [Chryseosolibacter indicus]MBT1702472.1 hypothetical protein [Chryseosolibacter indicus]
MLNPIFAVEITYGNAPITILEKFALSNETVSKLLTQLQQKYEEVFILSSDTRFIVYVVGDTITHLQQCFVSRPIPKEHIQIFYNTSDSITHLFATACGLLSARNDRTKLLLDLKRAHKSAAEKCTIKGILHNAIIRAIEIGSRNLVDSYLTLSESWNLVMREAKRFVHTLRRIALSPVLSAFLKTYSHNNSNHGVLPGFNGLLDEERLQIKQYANDLIKGTPFKLPNHSPSFENNTIAPDPMSEVKVVKNVAFWQFNLSRN